MDSTNSINKHTPLGKLVVYALFISFVIFTTYPLFWLGYSSIKTKSEIQNDPLAFAEVPQWGNFSEAWEVGNIGTGYMNSTIYLVFTLIIVLIASMMAAYVFAKSPFKKLTKVLKAAVGLGILISTHSIMIPLFLMLKTFGLTGSNARLGIILTYSAVALPMAVFIAADFIKGLPDSLVESAEIDGCGRFQAFIQIILPMTKPVMATIAIITALGTWNEFLLGFILSNRHTKALPPTIIAFANPRTPEYHLQMAGLVISIIPMIVLYAIFNKSITKGVVGGAIKG
ncbi:MAG: carbohydrate ABC transporter permease [Spirochaetaceae bacterium]